MIEKETYYELAQAICVEFINVFVEKENLIKEKHNGFLTGTTTKAKRGCAVSVIQLYEHLIESVEFIDSLVWKLSMDIKPEVMKEHLKNKIIALRPLFYDCCYYITNHSQKQNIMNFCKKYITFWNYYYKVLGGKKV